MISLIMLGSVMNYLTRSTLAVAAPTVLHELRIGEREYSWIVGAFQGAIMAQPICGYVLDVLGLKRGFALVSGADGTLITSAKKAAQEATLSIAFHDGEIKAKPV